MCCRICVDACGCECARVRVRLYLYVYYPCVYGGRVYALDVCVHVRVCVFVVWCCCRGVGFVLFCFLINVFKYKFVDLIVRFLL